MSAVRDAGVTTCTMCKKSAKWKLIELPGCTPVKLIICNGCDKRHCKECAETVLDPYIKRCPKGHWL